MVSQSFEFRIGIHAHCIRWHSLTPLNTLARSIPMTPGSSQNDDRSSRDVWRDEVAIRLNHKSLVFVKSDHAHAPLRSEETRRAPSLASSQGASLIQWIILTQPRIRGRTCSHRTCSFITHLHCSHPRGLLWKKTMLPQNHVLGVHFMII